MAKTNNQTLANTQDDISHPYHLVKPSPWPVVGSLAAGLLAVGALLYIHDGPKWVLVLSLIGVLTVMALWWRDVVRESVGENVHTVVVKIGLRYGMALFILSEVMFFFAFFWAIFDTNLFPKVVDITTFPEWVGPGQSLQSALNSNANWPPPGISILDPFALPLTMTLILLLSGCTVTWAHEAIQKGHTQDVEKALSITILLGVIFLCFQVYEYNHLDFALSDGIYPTTFYMATGFHGFHVLVGVIFLSVCWFRTMRGHFTSKSYFGLEAAAWYWHFVDVVWLFLFTSLYWWGSIPR